MFISNGLFDVAFALGVQNMASPCQRKPGCLKQTQYPRKRLTLGAYNKRKFTLGKGSQISLACG